MIALFFFEAFCILIISRVSSKTFPLHFICDYDFAHPSSRMCLILWSICLSKLQQLLLACAAQKCPRMLPKGCSTSKEMLQAHSSQKTGACGALSPKGGCWHGCKRKSSFQGAALEFPSVGEHWALQGWGSKPGSSMQVVKIFPEARAAVWGTPGWVKAPRALGRWSLPCGGLRALSVLLLVSFPACKLLLSYTTHKFTMLLFWIMVGVSPPNRRHYLFARQRGRKCFPYVC